MKACASAVVGCARNCARGRALDDAAVMQERDLVGEAPHLPQIVRDQHHARSLRAHGADQALDRRGRGRIEIGGRLVEDQDLRTRRQRAGDRQQLLLAAREHAGRHMRQMRKPRALQRARARARRRAGRATPAMASAYSTLASAERRSSTGR